MNSVINFICVLNSTLKETLQHNLKILLKISPTDNGKRQQEGKTFE
jgi:hypothetical protein